MNCAMTVFHASAAMIVENSASKAFETRRRHQKSARQLEQRAAGLPASRGHLSVSSSRFSVGIRFRFLLSVTGLVLQRFPPVKNDNNTNQQQHACHCPTNGRTSTVPWGVRILAACVATGRRGGFVPVRRAVPPREEVMTSSNLRRTSAY